MACKNTQDIIILESLLIALRSALTEKEKIAEFLDKENNDGLKAIDFCRFKNRHDMAVVLEGFVNTSQQIFEVPDYKLEINHEYSIEKILSNPEFNKVQNTKTSNWYT